MTKRQLIIGCLSLLTVLTIGINHTQIAESFDKLTKTSNGKPQLDKSALERLQNNNGSAQTSGRVQSSARQPYTSNGSAGFASGALPNINESSFVALLSSQNTAMVEYALNRARMNCMWFMTPSGAVENLTSSGGNPFANGLPVPAPIKSTKETRERAALDVHKKCVAFMGDFSFDDARLQSYRQSSGLQAISNARQTARDKDGAWFHGDPSNADLTKKILQEPYIGLLSLSKHLYAENELPTIAGDKYVPALTELSIDYLLMCRLGEDCSPGSVTSNRMCALTGLCGGYVEDTLMKYFYDAGLDWSRFDSFVRRIQAATSTGDISVFRKKKP